jgi:NADH-quinone oxidoreductase subunit J
MIPVSRARTTLVASFALTQVRCRTDIAVQGFAPAGGRPVRRASDTRLTLSPHLPHRSTLFIDREKGVHGQAGRARGAPLRFHVCPGKPMLGFAAFFYLFAGLAVGSAFMVIVARNPVHSVLYLILTFVNASGLFVLMGAEFLAMILVVVYVGAVAVLFLFVVMMLDVDFVELRQGFARYLPIGALIAGIFAVELILVVGAWTFTPEALNMRQAASALPADAMNTRALGLVLYTKYVYFFQAAGMILLVAMIGAIVLTLREPKPQVKRQDVMKQNARTRESGMAVVRVESGAGVSEKADA